APLGACVVPTGETPEGGGPDGPGADGARGTTEASSRRCALPAVAGPAGAALARCRPGGRGQRTVLAVGVGGATRFGGAGAGGGAPGRRGRGGVARPRAGAGPPPADARGRSPSPRARLGPPCGKASDPSPGGRIVTRAPPPVKENPGIRRLPTRPQVKALERQDFRPFHGFWVPR